MSARAQEYTKDCITYICSHEAADILSLAAHVLVITGLEHVGARGCMDPVVNLLLRIFGRAFRTYHPELLLQPFAG